MKYSPPPRGFRSTSHACRKSWTADARRALLLVLFWPPATTVFSVSGPGSKPGEAPDRPRHQLETPSHWLLCRSSLLPARMSELAELRVAVEESDGNLLDR